MNNQPIQPNPNLLTKKQEKEFYDNYKADEKKLGDLEKTYKGLWHDKVPESCRQQGNEVKGLNFLRTTCPDDYRQIIPVLHEYATYQVYLLERIITLRMAVQAHKEALDPLILCTGHQAHIMQLQRQLIELRARLADLDTRVAAINQG